MTKNMYKSVQVQNSMVDKLITTWTRRKHWTNDS